MEEDVLYKALAPYYDVIHGDKDYAGEAKKVMQIIKKHKKSKGKRLLDVGCGTGRHVEHFQKQFACTGVDVNPKMLALAKKRVKGAAFKKADMAKLDLGEKFDAVTSLFSAVGYVKKPRKLKRAIQNFADHLAPGGVLVIEPWFPKREHGMPKGVTLARDGLVHAKLFEGRGAKIARVTVSHVPAHAHTSSFDDHYLIGTPKGVTYVKSRDELGLFGIKETLGYMRDAGFSAKYLKKGLRSNRGLYVGVKK